MNNFEQRVHSNVAVFCHSYKLSIEVLLTLTGRCRLAAPFSDVVNLPDADSIDGDATGADASPQWLPMLPVSPATLHEKGPKSCLHYVKVVSRLTGDTLEQWVPGRIDAR